MDALVPQLFKKEEIPHLRKLWQDEDSRHLIRQEIGKRLEEHRDIITGNSLNQLICILSQTNFECEEVVEVSAMVFYGIRKPDILPSLVEHKGKDFVVRAFISLSLFRKTMEKLCERLGAPKPDYYERIAITYAEQERLLFTPHFRQWVCFLDEHLAS